jgi:hypothetical protein
MKRTNPLWISALVVALPGLLYCGGSTDTGGGGTGGSGQATGAGGGLSTGSSTTGGFTTVTGTTTTTTATTTTGMTTGAGGSAGSGGGTTTGPGAGGKGGAGVGGGGAGMGGANAGGRGGAPVDAGACPAMQPGQGTACPTLMEVCDYPGFACTCAPAGMTRDGGMRDGWNCVRVRADGGGVDASACPRVAPVNRTICPTLGEVCPYAMETCTCQMAGGGADRWACVGPDAAGD